MQASAAVPGDHVAFMAIHAKLDANMRQPETYDVVAIGTKAANPAEWRCASMSLDEFLSRSKGGGAIFRDVAPNGVPCEGPIEFIDDRPLAAKVGRQAFSNLVLVAFYAFDQDRGPDGMPQPLVRLDTIGFVEESGDLKLGSPTQRPGWAVSTLYIVPDVSRQGVITWFNLRAQIPLAMNGHLVSSRDTNGDRFDTRALLDITAVQQAQPRSLWDKSGSSVPSPDKDAVFEEVKLKVTTRSWNTDSGSRDTAEVTQDRLSELRKKTRSRNITHIPLWADPHWEARRIPQPGRLKIVRHWGFRVADYRKGTMVPRRLIFRFEMQAEDSPTKFRDAVGHLLADWLPTADEISGKLSSPYFEEFSERLSSPYFSQEQRKGDIAAPLAPCSTVRWIVGARLAPENGDYAGMAERLLSGLTLAQPEIGDSLRRVADGSKISWVPSLSDFQGADQRSLPWHVVGQLRNSKSWRRLISNARATAGDPARRTIWNVIEPRFTTNYWNPESLASPITANASFKNFVSRTGEPVGGTMTLGITAPERATFDSNIRSDCTDKPAFQPAVSERDFHEHVDGGVRFGIHVDTMPGTEVLIGAFRLDLGHGASSRPQREVDEQMCLIRRYRASEPRLGHGVELALRLPVQRILPEGQDAPVAAGRSIARDASGQLLADATLPAATEALFFPLFDPMTRPAVRRYELLVRETAGRGRDHESSLKLRSRSISKDTDIPAKGIVVVIDPEPFRVAGVKYLEPRSAASDQSDEVAVWNAGGEGGLSWRVKDDSQSVQMILPPQVLGEAMEKNRSDDTSRPPDIAPEAPAAARFGGPTILEIDPTYAETDYREPGWNLRRILGYPGQRSPGARLRDLRVELVYGLTTRLTPRSEVWISEIAGTLGVPATRLPDTAGRDDRRRGPHIKLANAVLDAEKRRLAVEKLWSGRPDLPLKIEQGLSFGLRRRRIEGGAVTGGPATPFRWPVPGTIPADLPLSPTQRGIIEETFSVSRDDRDSFPGGVPWAFESANILAEVYRQPLSESGRVQDVHLSALGAWAGQRALFAEDKSAIDTEVTLGRLQRYKLERIGRIGALWHRAKHVIVYERAVVPSRQFYNRHPIGAQQDEHAGRPILRKVEEYVELLQPTRRYPENGTSVSAAGCFTGVEFKSKRIAVDSRWGGDVRREGWAVPLWNPTFEPSGSAGGGNPDDPSLIYPKPQICSIYAGPDGGETLIEIDEPQKLVFYTSTLPGDRGDNTDAWRAVRDIDFVDLPVPVAGRLSPRSDQLSDALLPAEPQHVPGYERLTLKLKSSEEPVALMYGRAVNGPSAVLKNITIARSIPVVGDNTGRSAQLVELGSYAANIRAEIDGAVGRALSILEKLDPKLNRDDQIDAARDEARRALSESFRDAFKEVAPPAPDVSKLAAAIPPLADNVVLRKRLDADVRSEVSRIANVARALVGEVRAGICRPLEGARGFAASTDELLKALEIPGHEGQYYELPEEERDELVEVLRDIRERLWDVSEDLKEEIVELADSVEFDVGRVAIAAGGDVAAFGQGIRDGLRALEEELGELDTAIVNAGGQISGDVKQAAADVASVVNAFGEAMAAVRRRIESGSNASSLRALVTVCGLIESAASITASTLAVLPGGPVPAAASEALRRLNGWVPRIEAVLTELIAALDAGGGSALATLAATCKDLVSTLADRLRARVDDLAGWLTSDPVMDAIVAATMALSQDVEDDDFTGWAERAIEAVMNLVAALREVAEAVEEAVDRVVAELQLLIDDLERQANELVAGAVGPLHDAANTFEALLRDLISRPIGGDFGREILAAYGLDQAEAVAAQILAAADVAIAGVRAGANRVVEDIKRGVYAAAAEATREIEDRGRQFLGSLQTSVTDALGKDPDALADQATRLAQEASDVLRLLRAVGDPPKTDRLGLNRPEVAYVLKEADKIIDITPAVALVNRVSDTLAAVDQAGKALGDLIPGMGFRVPTGKLAENIVPDALKGLSVSKLIPNIGGLDLRGLLTRAAFPDLDDVEAVKITQGFDKAERRLWMMAVIDVPFTAPADILAFGPVTLTVDEARFYAESRLTAGLDGSRQRISGRITGDWRVVCSGQDIVTFRRTGLSFDESGKLDFKISPERVELADVLQFLTNFLSASGKGEGLVVEPLMRGGIPAGVAATLDLALPDLTLGAFAVTSLSLHVMFGVAAIPEFAIIGEVSVAQRVAPFTLSVWILNGGGYLTQRMSFRPTARPKPVLTYTLDVGIVAGVGLAFNAGVVSGGVWLQIGCSIAINWTTERGGNSTALTVFILARGNVDVAGLVTANIMLLLEVSYDGARMIGRGTLRLSFKISMFYTLRVNQRVEYAFIGQRKADAQQYSDAYA